MNTPWPWLAPSMPVVIAAAVFCILASNTTPSAPGAVHALADGGAGGLKQDTVFSASLLVSLVRSDGTTPVIGATVKLRGVVFPAAETLGGGDYLFSAMPPGSYTVKATTSNGESLSGAAPVNELRAGEDVAVTIRMFAPGEREGELGEGEGEGELEPSPPSGCGAPSGPSFLGGSLFVGVREEGTNTPILDATVSVSPQTVSPVSDNIDGVYSFPILPPGGYTVGANAEGYRGEQQFVQVEGGGPASLLFRLRTE